MILILGRISINGSVKWLGVPDFHRTGGPFWTANLLAPRSSWGYGGTTTNQNWGIKPGGPYGSVAVMWIHPVPVRPAYTPRIMEKAHATAHCWSPLGAASVTITFKAIVWHACVFPLPTAKQSLIGGLIDRMIIGMV